MSKLTVAGSPSTKSWPRSHMTERIALFTAWGALVLYALCLI